MTSTADDHGEKTSVFIGIMCIDDHQALIGGWRALDSHPQYRWPERVIKYRTREQGTIKFSLGILDVVLYDLDKVIC